LNFGDTIDEVLKMAKEAITLYIKSLQAYGEELKTK